MQHKAEFLTAELARKDDAHKKHLTLTTNASSAVIEGIAERRLDGKMVIDRNKLCVRNAVGRESLEHLQGRDIHDLLEGLEHHPATLLRWFWLLRGPYLRQNHNVLIIPGVPSQALVCRKTGWTATDTDTALKEVIRSDILRLYSFLEKWESDRVVKDFRFLYVLHGAMSDVNNDDDKTLKHVMSAVVEQLTELTQELYAERSNNGTPQELMDEEYEGNEQSIKEALQKVVELTSDVAKWTKANRLIKEAMKQRSTVD